MSAKPNCIISPPHGGVATLSGFNAAGRKEGGNRPRPVGIMAPALFLRARLFGTLLLATLFLATLFLATLFLATLGGAASVASAQQRLVTQEVWASAPIEGDNMARARRQAVKNGQHYLLLAMMKELVLEHWIDYYQKEIRNRILNRQTRYIQSFVVKKETTSEDRTKFEVVLSVRINRDQLIRDLRTFPLPIKKDPRATVTLFYSRDDPVLHSYSIRQDLLNNLRFQLNLLRYQLKDVVRLEAYEANLLAEGKSGPSEVRKLLAGRKSDAGLMLSFQALPKPEPENPDAPGGKGLGVMYRVRDGAQMGRLDFNVPQLSFTLPARNQRQRTTVFYAWVIPTVKAMEPIVIRPMGPTLAVVAPLTLRVAGFESVEDQDDFEKVFFQPNTEFSRFRLVGLSAVAASYVGPFGEDRTKLRRALTGKRVGDFRVREVSWQGEDLLEIQVERRRRPKVQELRLFPLRSRPKDVQLLIEEFLRRDPKTEYKDPRYSEREDNAWLNRANIAPFNNTIYGYLDSRSDRDTYVFNSLLAGEMVTIEWAVISRTLLTPSIRLYNEKGDLVKTFYPQNEFRYLYTVPKGQHRFFMEVSDRFGPLPVDTGGYLNFHYLFRSTRKRR